MLHVIRLIFVAVCAIGGWAISLYMADRNIHVGEPWQGAVAGAGAALCLVLLELGFSRKFAGVLSTLICGIVVGVVISVFLNFALNLIPQVRRLDPEDKNVIELASTVIFIFISMITILHARDNFKFIIPFVEFQRQGKFGRPVLLDTSAIIDGRVADMLEMKILDTPVIVPRFVLTELHALSDSADKMKRSRGKRGLDILERLKQNTAIDLRIQDVPVTGVEGVDAKLIRAAKLLDGRIVSGDVNLAKVAQVQDVEVINMAELANALRSPVLQGDRARIKIMKPGEQLGQGIGYLDDGTMVVAEECAGRIGQEVELIVTNVIQGSSGRIVFGKPAEAPAKR